MDNRLITFAVTAAICLASCSNDEMMEQNSDPKGKAITFYAKVGHSTRAVETEYSNLGDFYVFAKSVHPDGSLYSAYLVGSESGNIPTPETAKRKIENSTGSDGSTTTVSTWSLGHDVYLPSGITDAVFWAFTDGQKDMEPILSSGTISFDHSAGPGITGYTPAKAGNNSLEREEQTIWADGSQQKDLVSAFGQAKQDNGTLSNIINLNFSHLLSQVTINAAQKAKADTDHRIVKVKGAWIVNAKDKANLSAGYSYTDNKGSDHPSWSIQEDATFTQYGTYFKNAIDLSSYTGNNDNGWRDLTFSSLMLIPQENTAWNAADISDFKGTTTAYIMLLCRVELKHAGDKHEGADVKDGDIHTENGYHYHQQFPVNADKKYNPNEYGLTCIPVPINWEKGIHYTFNLDICGSKSGAGVYPPNYDSTEILNLIPESERNNITITTIPTGKKPGDPVLDEPIKFTVEVKKWSDGEPWTNGNDKTNTTD